MLVLQHYRKTGILLYISCILIRISPNKKAHTPFPYIIDYEQQVKIKVLFSLRCKPQAA